MFDRLGTMSVMQALYWYRSLLVLLLLTVAVAKRHREQWQPDEPTLQQLFNRK